VLEEVVPLSASIRMGAGPEVGKGRAEACEFRWRTLTSNVILKKDWKADWQLSMEWASACGWLYLPPGIFRLTCSCTCVKIN
jgi:hypothetical protein